MTGDRLTLKTAEESAIYRAVFICEATGHVSRRPQAITNAEDAVRAYRERLPEASAEGCECGSAVIWHNRHQGSCKACGSMHTRERLPASDADADVGASWALERWDEWALATLGYSGGVRVWGRVRMRARLAKLVRMGLGERGPTEGASDAVDIEVLRWVADALARSSEPSPTELGIWANRIRAAIGDECPPTGGASPEPSVPDAPGWWWVKGVHGWQPVEVFSTTGGELLIEQAHGDDVRNGGLDVEDHEWGGRCLRGAPASDAAWSLRVEHAELLARHRVLTGAVELEISGDWADIDVDDIATALRAALDTAVGDGRPSTVQAASKRPVGTVLGQPVYERCET